MRTLTMVSALIVAAGRGLRMGPGCDKLFLPVAHQPLVVHTWRAFEVSASIDEIVLVVRNGQQPVFADLARQHHFRKPYRVVAGGKQRQDSVSNGLEVLASETEIVVIHDGARPCVIENVIKATIEAAREVGAAVSAQRVTDTIKESSTGQFVTRHLDRSCLWAVQTPQSFRVAVIREALRAAQEKGLHLTDDTAACELIGQPVKLVENPWPNPKLTFSADIAYIEGLLQVTASR